MSRTPQAVFDALAAAKARREADRLALADRDDDVGDELADRDAYRGTYEGGTL